MSPFLTFFSRSSFSFVQEASCWFFSEVATFSLLLRDSIRAFLFVASSVKVFTCRETGQQEGKSSSVCKRCSSCKNVKHQEKHVPHSPVKI